MTLRRVRSRHANRVDWNPLHKAILADRADSVKAILPNENPAERATLRRVPRWIASQQRNEATPLWRSARALSRQFRAAAVQFRQRVRMRRVSATRVSVRVAVLRSVIRVLGLVADRAENFEIVEFERRAALAERLDMVRLKPLRRRAAPLAAIARAGERGVPDALPALSLAGASRPAPRALPALPAIHD